MLALEKSESDRMQQEVRLAPAAALVSWRLDQSVRDTTARRQLDAIRRLSQPTTDSPFEALLRMVRPCLVLMETHSRTHAWVCQWGPGCCQVLVALFVATQRTHIIHQCSSCVSSEQGGFESFCVCCVCHRRCLWGLPRVLRGRASLQSGCVRQAGGRT